jgi:hypothetical protein
MARTRPWLAVAAAAICWGLVTIVLMHLVNARNPVLDTLSSYAITDRGGDMLATGILSVAVGSLAVLGALTAARVPTGATTRVLFGTWSGGLMLAAAFPASYAELPDPVSGEIHQYSCLVAFLSVPAIGLTLLDRLRTIPALAGSRATVARWTRYSLAGLALFGISYALAKYPDTPVLAELGALLPVGLTQRITLIVHIGLLGSLLALAARAVSGRGREVVPA